MSAHYRVRVATPGTPFAGAGDVTVSYEVPSDPNFEDGGFLWLRTVSFQCTSTSDAGGRYVLIRVIDRSGLIVGDATLGSMIGPDTVANVTYGYTVYPYQGMVLPDGVEYLQAPLERVYLLESDQVQVIVKNAQVGDAFTREIVLGLNRQYFLPLNV